MKIKIEINCDNAAFEGDGCGKEIGRILETIAHECESLNAADVQMCMPTRLRDHNGNTVGFVEVEG